MADRGSGSTLRSMYGFRTSRRFLTLAVVPALLAAGGSAAVAHAARPPRTAPVPHWIGVRTEHGVPQLFDRRTGKRFVPRGANYQRLIVRDGIRVSGLFSPSTWRPGLVDDDLARMHALGFNVVRSFIDLCVKECISRPGGELRDDYVANIARSLDPTALVTMGFFEPQGDNRLVYPRAMLEHSALDFIDFHAYPGSSTMAHVASAFGMSNPTPRPVVMGELGAFKFAFPDPGTGAWELAIWQAASCAYGFAGWVYWLWTASDVEVWGGTEAGGVIDHELSPTTRPDPCSAKGIPRNRSLDAAATATASISGQGPDKAIDGFQQTAWIAGAGPPQAIEVHLPETLSVDGIQLLVAQDPAGTTDHRILVRGPSGSFHLVRRFRGATAGGDWLIFRPATPVAGVRHVRIRTVESPSWVAWSEIRIYGHVPGGGSTA